MHAAHDRKAHSPFAGAPRQATARHCLDWRRGEVPRGREGLQDQEFGDLHQRRDVTRPRSVAESSPQGSFFGVRRRYYFLIQMR